MQKNCWKKLVLEHHQSYLSDENPTGLAFEIEYDSESKFRFLAKKLSISSKRFRYAMRQYEFSRYLLFISLISALAPIPSFFNPLPLYVQIATIGVVIAIVSFIIAGIFWMLRTNNEKKLKSLAVKYSKIENLEREYEEFLRAEN